MIFNQKWQGACIKDDICGVFFEAEVPGNIQLDYAKANNFEDVNYGDTCKKFKELEDCGWLYRTNIEYKAKDSERIFFVTHGIEYEYDVILNKETLLHHEGMFSTVEIDITDKLKNGNLLEIYIHPHPKRKGAPVCTRDEADQSCKPAVEYGWDWAPRLLVSGIWEETYIETRNEETICDCEISYVLNDNRTCAEVTFDVVCNTETIKEIYSPEGELLYSGTDSNIHLSDISLWWCNGQGNPDLYKWVVKTNTDRKSGYIGFRTVRLVMNEGQWEIPDKFPKSRSNPPFTIELNGREIFAKGSNWVNPEIFIGTITKETYEPQINYAKEANMNILRCWGGALVNKESFYECCDKSGIMVWQEFPLACNNYVGNNKYLKVLEQEAVAIIRRLRKHACITLWCGGNELFNKWSKMTDQSCALRLLNKLCYELDRDTPFIMTSPVCGVAHGPYVFKEMRSKKTVFEIFRSANNISYTEFGVGVITDYERIKKIIPREYLHTPSKGTPWETHNGYSAFPYEGNDTWLCLNMIDEIFGKQITIEDYIEKSNILQCEGLKFIFEESRRQKPTCSMAINWCYNEPWINVACLTLLAYPDEPRKSFYAVRDALRPVLPSAAPEHFVYSGGDTLSADIWLLNDSPQTVSDTVEIYLECDGTKEHIMTWNTGIVPANTNKCGHKIQVKLPNTITQLIKLILNANCGNSTYTILLEEKVTEEVPVNALNM